MLEFKKFIARAELLRPPDFQAAVQQIEYREDPLTGSRCIINSGRAQRARQTEKPATLPAQAIDESAERCFFCPSRIGEETPKFTPDIWPEGRIEKGESIVFPNLFPFAEHHAVATLTSRHFLDLDQFEPRMIADSFLACREWMLSVGRMHSDARYPLFVWNHMPPSGASIVHPHVQALLRQRPTARQSELLLRSAEYFQRNGRSYWLDLIENERDIGERWIAENDSLAVLASFAPRGLRDIQLVFREATSLTDLNEKQVDDLADSLTRVLRGYRDAGVGSFNVITFSGAVGERPPHYSLHARIISRPFPNALYANDTGPFERLQNEPVIETAPEQVARQMREGFGR